MTDRPPLDRYTCEQAFARVYEWLDKVLCPEEERLVREHLAICEGCTQHFKFEADLLRKIREKCQSSRAPETLKQRVRKLLDNL